MTMGNFGFSESDARRIARVTRRVERLPQAGYPGRKKYPSGGGGTPVIYLQLNSFCGADGGYPWQAVALMPLISVPHAGAGYTMATVTAAGGNGTGATYSATIGAAMTPQAGQIVSVQAVSDGQGYNPLPVPTLSIAGDGAGATAVINGMAWVADGPIVAGPARLAFEMNGLRAAGIGTTYPATFGPGGRLLFTAVPGPFPCFTTSPITPRVGARPGRGTAVIVLYDPINDTTSTSATIKVYNMKSGVVTGQSYSVGVNKYIDAYWSQNVYWLGAGECP